MEDEHKI